MKLLINCSSHQVLFWPLLPPSLNKKLCQNDGVCPSFLLSFLSLGWNCLSEDTVLFRRATQLRPPLGCGFKPTLPAKAGEETSTTHGPWGPKPPVHWRSSDRPLFRTHVQVQTSCPSPHASLLQSQQGPPGLLLSSLVAWRWCRPKERGTSSFLLSLRKVNGL